LPKENWKNPFKIPKSDGISISKVNGL